MSEIITEIMNAVDRYAYAYAIRTDGADFITDKNADICEEKLLEIRCFDERGEFYARRDCADGEFSVREITADTARTGENVFSEETYADGSFDEAQYLDIDSAASKDGKTYATGGGCYHLPPDAQGKPLILVRIYYKYDEDGVARKFDWRLVEFADKETVGKE